MKLKSNIKLLVIWVFLIFILLEISLRFLGYKPLEIPYNYLTSKPKNCIIPDSITGMKLNQGTFQVTINQKLNFTANQSRKNERITFKKDTANLSNIFIYGCSYTYGMGVNNQETFPFLLDKNLPEYKVRNKAVPGFGTTQSLIQLKEDIKNDSPKIVILSYYDFHDERNILSNSYRYKLYLGLKSNIDLSKGIENNLNENWNYPFINKSTKKIEYVNIKNIYSPFPLIEYSSLMNLLDQKFNAQSSDLKIAKEISLELISEMATICKKKNIQFYLAIMEKNNTITQDFCEQNDIDVIDCSISLEQKGYRNVPYDQHPSPLAHSDYAKKLQDFFKSKHHLK